MNVPAPQGFVDEQEPALPALALKVPAGHPVQTTSADAVPAADMYKPGPQMESAMHAVRPVSFA